MASPSRNKKPPSSASYQTPFWKERSLTELSTREWESLCDGCGKCCLHKLEDENSGNISYTDVACSLLNTETCKCTNYRNRVSLVPDCLKLDPEILSSVSWLPETCAYKLIYEEKDLHWWHPLISGDLDTVHKAGISVRGRAVSEECSDELETHIVEWPNKNGNDN